MNLAIFDTVTISEEGTWVDLLDMDYETPLGCRILVLGPDSKDAAAIAEEEDRVNRQAMIAAISSKAAKASDDDVNPVEREIRKAVAVTKNWDNIEWGDAVYPYSKENAVKLFTFCPHIRQQVVRHYNNRLNFTPPEYKSWKESSGRGSRSTTRAKKVR